ncbi:MAG TPA: response regulator, partial [Acidimicrobiales bacterium]
ATLPEELAEAFGTRLREWEAEALAAGKGGDFVWVGTSNLDEMQRLLTFGPAIAAGSGEHTHEFHRALMSAVADAMARTAAPAAHAVPAPPAPPASAPGERPVRVFLVDDTADLRLLLRIALDADARFEVVGEAVNGADAVERAPDASPDVVLLDLMMPVMDGFTALPLLREALGDAVRIVVFSAMDPHEQSARTQELGADAFLSKSVGIRDLLDTLFSFRRQ